jgi:hypothetical protein
MLLVKGNEIWNRDAHLVGTPNKVGLLDIIVSLNAFSVLIKLDGLTNWVGNDREVLLVFVVAEPLFLHFNVVD